MKKIRIAAVVVATSVLVAVPTAQARTQAPARSQGTIVQVASANGSFKTLVKLVKAAGLAPALSGKGPLTVFAPTDAAFAKVPKATLAALGKDKAKLKAVLLYHVVSGKVTSKQVVKLTSAKTLNGASIKIKVVGGKVKLNGSTTVTAVDVAASNGVIHVIDHVLLPPA